jgi:hypothetical protein
MRNVLFLMFCSGCAISGYNYPADMTNYNNVSVTMRNNPCQISDAEFVEMVKFERLARQVYGSDQANSTILQYRMRVERTVNDRCMRFEQQEHENNGFTSRYYQFQIAHPWNIKPTKQEIPAPVVVKKELDTKGSFWCRVEGECFRTEGDCQVDYIENKLYDCSEEKLISCVDHLVDTVRRPNMSCFASTDSCNSFCEKRSAKLNWRFACQNECQIFDTQTGLEFSDMMEDPYR